MAVLDSSVPQDLRVLHCPARPFAAACPGRSSEAPLGGDDRQGLRRNRFRYATANRPRRTDRDRHGARPFSLIGSARRQDGRAHRRRQCFLPWPRRRAGAARLYKVRTQRNRFEYPCLRVWMVRLSGRGRALRRQAGARSDWSQSRGLPRLRQLRRRTEARAVLARAPRAQLCGYDPRLAAHACHVG